MHRTGSVMMAVGLMAALVASARAEAGASPRPEPNSFLDVVSLARARAGEPFKPPDTPLPDFLRDLGYDGYQRIRFRSDKALWYGVPSRFQVQFFHPGYLFREPVRIHVIEGRESQEIRFVSEMFDYGDQRFPQPVPRELYFAGLRLLYPLNRRDKMDEVAVFLGSSFFRLIGAHQGFGASARGLAIDTAEPSGEEFPRFAEFWIEKPPAQADQIRLLALLESRRATGACQFLIKPGESTIADVEASLFLREEVKKLGLAPLTSMFFFGKNRTRYFPDFRPEVHDSDGLLIETADHQWLWRPLDNPPKVHRVSAFTNVASFGLLQRDRDFDHYQDLQAHFEQRPSYWVTPQGDWGPGRVELVEIPSAEERNDNIVAYWVPEQKLAPRQEYRLRYSLRAERTDPNRPPPSLLQVQATRIQPGGKDKSRTRFIVDFAGTSLPAKGVVVTAQVQTSRGKAEHVVAQPNEVTGGWRSFFDLVVEGEQPAELRLRLVRKTQAVSETWVYHWAP